MRRIILALSLLLLAVPVIAQNIGINANGASPNTSAMLDIDVSAIAGTKRGLLIPRMNTTQRDAIPTPATSLLLFNTTTNQFEYFDGALWRGILSNVNAGWTLTGNAGTSPATNFVGTTDTQPLRFRTANQFAGSLPVVASQLASYGLLAGLNNTGSGNTFVGNSAGLANTTGGSNTFLGNNAGAANVGSANNTYVGTSAGAANVNGAQNVFIGRLAGGNGTTGSDNILIGNGAGISNTANNNVMIGSFSGNANSTGGGNTFMGTQSGQATSTGGQNTFIGTGAGGTNATGSQNTLVGNGASVNASNLTNATAIGRGSRVDASDALVLGSVAGINAATSTSRVGIGTTNPLDRLHVAGNIRMVDGNQAIGRVMVSDANGTASWIDPLTVATGLAWTLTGNTGTNPATNFIGTTDAQPIRFRANNQLVGQLPAAAGGVVSLGILAGATSTGTGNTLIGNNAGDALTTGTNNTLLGSNAGGSAITNGGNTLIGTSAGSLLTGGFGNVMVGSGAGVSSITGNQNVIVGLIAGPNNQADNNAMVGTFAGNANTTGTFNAFFGTSAGVNNTSGSENTFLGTIAGGTNTTGSNNTALGGFTDVSTINLTNATAVGHRARVAASNTMVLGSINGVNGATADVNVGIGTSTPARALHVSRGSSGATSNAGTKLLVEDNVDTYAQFLTPPADESGLLFGNTVGSIRSAIVFNSSVADGLDFRTGGNNTRMVIDPTGRVGLGISAPASLLHVHNGLSGATPNANADVVVEDDTDTYTHFLAPATAESGILFGTPALSVRSGMYFNSAVTNGLDFRTGSNTTQMVIDQSGNVGIGIASPITDLHVEGGVTLGRFSVPALAAGNNTVNVLDRSYLLLSSAFPTFSTVITLSSGFGIGQILIIECSAAGTNGFTVTDNNNTRLNGDHAMTDNDILTLIWNGADWLEVNFSPN